MKKLMLAAAAMAAFTSGAAMAQQAESPWMVRVRAVHLDSANKDSTGLGLSVNNKTMPELDISYFFSYGYKRIKMPSCSSSSHQNLHMLDIIAWLQSYINWCYTPLISPYPFF